MPLLNISINRNANLPPSKAGNGNKLITARERLIEEASVNKIKILSEIKIDEVATSPLIFPNPIGPIALGPSNIGLLDLLIIPIIDR